MSKFFFTYGLEGHPYVGGWTEVECQADVDERELFRAVHPSDGCLACADVYTEAEFKKTKMCNSGNFGRRCVERIVVEREAE